ncbi:hypothetical protein POTOM_057708 [Populus tomentosa]|uniref:Uncharacterized protein n=1 Tax=Populus tomentosa TaxID=118781 RepID=A0A8X8C210_POPTO|nr:hypothetical protein POTOM_057708 [Populus tomentosa]
MAAKILSKSLFHHCTPNHTPLKSPPLIPLYLHHRHRSSKPQLIEINLSSPSLQSDGGNGSEDEEGFFIKKLEEILHRVMLQKSTPDWLPFRPGSSFWVPPVLSVNDLIHKFAGYNLSDEETLSLTTCRGWPSASYFIKVVKDRTSKWRNSTLLLISWSFATVYEEEVNEEEEEEEEERVDLKVVPPEEMEGKVVVEVLTGPTDIDVAVKEEKGHVNIKVDRKEGGEVGREVVVQGNEVEGKLEVLILAGSSLEDEEG